MSVMYKFEKVTLPTSPKKGYYYAKAVRNTTLTTAEIAETIQENCTVKESDILAVLSELKSVMHRELLAGNAVELDGIGTFSLSLRSASVASVADFNASTDIRGVRIAFSPERRKVGTREVSSASGTSTKAVYSYPLTEGVKYKADSSARALLAAAGVADDADSTDA